MITLRQDQGERHVPAAVAKHGITTLTDNLQPGEALSISRAFITFFRPELEARFLSGGKQPCANNNSSPFRSGK
jgi:hypothetical protein